MRATAVVLATFAAFLVLGAPAAEACSRGICPFPIPFALHDERAASASVALRHVAETSAELRLTYIALRTDQLPPWIPEGKVALVLAGPANGACAPAVAGVTVGNPSFWDGRWRTHVYEETLCGVTADAWIRTYVVDPYAGLATFDRIGVPTDVVACGVSSVPCPVT